MYQLRQRASDLTRFSTRLSTAGGPSFLWVRLVCLHLRFDFEGYERAVHMEVLTGFLFWQMVVRMGRDAFVFNLHLCIFVLEEQDDERRTTAGR